MVCSASCYSARRGDNRTFDRQPFRKDTPRKNRRGGLRLFSAPGKMKVGTHKSVGSTFILPGAEIISKAEAKSFEFRNTCLQNIIIFYTYDNRNNCHFPCLAAYVQLESFFQKVRISLFLLLYRMLCWRNQLLKSCTGFLIRSYTN